MATRKSNTLSIGYYLLGKYRIETVLGAGGFGITYMAVHEALLKQVVIKEYFPVEWSYRDGDHVVDNTLGGLPTSEAGEDACYTWGLERFLNEAQTLVRVEHPGVVRVQDYFQANGTAYIVMDYVEGEPLSQILQREKALPEEQVHRLIDDVLPALEAVHAQGYLHRDLKPANLYRRLDGRTILIDFGEARQALGRRSKSITSVFSPGYSPIEQYLTGGKGYGPWTDIYAFGTVLYHCVTGISPIEAPARVLNDPLQSAEELAAGRYSPVLLRLIDQAIAVRPEKRFPSIAQMRVAALGASNLELPIPNLSRSVEKPHLHLPRNEFLQQQQNSSRKSWWRPNWLLARIIQTISWTREHHETQPSGEKALKVKIHSTVATERGVAAGVSGVAVGGNVQGGIHIHSSSALEASSLALRNAYLKRVMERCGYLSLNGIDPAAAEQRDADSQLSLHTVYTTLLTCSPRPEEKGGLEPWALREKAEKKLLCSALEQLDYHARLVLQGDPGSGKSTFVNFIALCLAGETLEDDQINLQRLTAPLPNEKGEDGQESQPWHHGALLPVPVVLRDFAATCLPERGEATAETLWNFIAQELTVACQAECAPWLRQALREYGGLLLLDGLDEVPEAEHRREQVQQAVEAFVQSFSNCRVLVTSRTHAYQNQGWRLQGFTEATLAPFSNGQIRRFVARWYEFTASMGRLSTLEATGRAALLKRAIFNRPTLHELAQRPLLLTLMASLHAWHSGDLPEKREALYAETVDLLLNRWEQRLVCREQGHYQCIQPSLAEYLKVDKDQVRTVLEALAFEVHRCQPELTGTADLAEKDLVYQLFQLRNNPDANPKRLMEYLRDRASLLYPRGVGVYTFPHRSFQEYLAACYLTDEEYPDQIAELARAEPNRWREVTLLAGAKAARGTAASLWQLVDTLCFREPDDPAVEPADTWGAQIAAQALVETANLTKVSLTNQRKLARVQRWLIKLLRDEWLPATERVLTGNNLAALGDPRFDAEHWYLPGEPLFGFIEIPASSFLMGSDPQHDKQAGDDELPQHEVSLPSYYLARWPVTVAQFADFVRASGYEPASPDCLKGTANHPVVDVTWYDTMAYCCWIGEQLQKLAVMRLAGEQPLIDAEQRFWQRLVEGILGVGLPSEAEWEKAGRGTDGRIYPWGNQPDLQKANTPKTGLDIATSVGCFSGGVSPYGCEEIVGNIWEWTRSLWGENWQKPAFNYPYIPSDGREDLNASDEIRRVLRGGAFRSNARDARCACRGNGFPGNRARNGGFRVVVSPFFSDRRDL